MDKLVLVLNLLLGSGQPQLQCGDNIYRCAIGRSGVIENKIEGDGATPSGTYKLKTLYYREDKIPEPNISLPKVKITQDMGWCDDPKDPFYNQLIRLPYAASHEEMWREDDLYDLVIEMDHNSDPIIPGKGSAVFIHVASDDYASTAGCIALKKDDLIDLLQKLGPDTQVNIPVL